MTDEGCKGKFATPEAVRDLVRFRVSYRTGPQNDVFSVVLEEGHNFWRQQSLADVGGCIIMLW